MHLLIRWLINAVAIMVATQIIGGVSVRSFYTALVVALVLGLLNAVIRPILVLLTLPLTLLSMGLFIFIINALLVWFAASMIKGFEVAGFWPALMLGLFMWLVSLLTNALLTKR